MAASRLTRRELTRTVGRLLPVLWIAGTVVGLILTLHSLATDDFDGLNDFALLPFAMPWAFSEAQMLAPSFWVLLDNRYVTVAWMPAGRGIVNAYLIWMLVRREHPTEHVRPSVSGGEIGPGVARRFDCERRPAGIEAYLHAFTTTLRHHGDFSGRVSAGVFWRFVAVDVLITAASGLPAVLLDGPVATFFRTVCILFVLAMTIPKFTATLRRLHDRGRTGAWWIVNLVPIIGSLILVFFLVGRSNDVDRSIGV